MSINVDKLLISSDFYSVQGEGISSGIPAYFIRLSHCNLRCGMSSNFIKNLKKQGPDGLEDGEIFVGDLHGEGSATWTCDSTSQWLVRGESQDFNYLLNRWKEQSIYSDIIDGTIHLIWTGGEPTLPLQQKAIVNFFTYWSQYDELYQVYNEIETNGTRYINEPLFKQLDQINSSPKLSNAGMPKKMTCVPRAIERIMEHENYQFKFVISNQEDIEEVFKDFIVPFNIPLKNVVCMPGLDSQEHFHERTEWVLEMSKIYKFRGLTRLHISAWDKTLNV